MPPGFGIPEQVADARWLSERLMAQELRGLNQALLTSRASADVLSEAAALVSRARELLVTEPGRTFLQAHQSGQLDPERWADRSPITGRSHPASPPLRLSLDGSAVVGHVVYDDLFQGGPGIVHGGFVAAGFDHVLGAAALGRGVVCLTGKLSVKYRRPTRLYVPLEYRGEISSVVGRATLVVGTLRDADGVTAEAEGMFVELPAARMRELMDAHPTAAAIGEGD